MQYLAMNRFEVLKTEQETFEAAWRGRKTRLPAVAGFLSFTLLKGPENEDHILYASHTLWRSHADFIAWTRSEAFREAHANAGATAPLTLGHPVFEGFSAIQTVDADGAIVAAGEAADGRRAALAERLAKNPDGVLESLAREHGVSLLEATHMLPAGAVRWAESSVFDAVMSEVASWGDVLLLVHTPGLVLEVKGAVPPGVHGQGFFNMHGDSPIGGHVRADRCRAIAFVRRPFMGQDTASIQFFDADGGAMFKIFVRRDAERRLDGAQLAQFEALADRLGRAVAHAA